MKKNDLILLSYTVEQVLEHNPICNSLTHFVTTAPVLLDLFTLGFHGKMSGGSNISDGGCMFSGRLATNSMCCLLTCNLKVYMYVSTLKKMSCHCIVQNLLK